MQTDSNVTVGVAQITPGWMNKAATLEKVCDAIQTAADKGCRLVAFGEALVPGYPFWIERTDGARFGSDVQKSIHAFYARQAVNLEAGDLDDVCSMAAENRIMVVLGIIERAANRGGHSLYCTVVSIGTNGTLLSAHRKLVPTYEERLTWAAGDGHGLRVHPLDGFTVGALNCWENWMPLARTALTAQGENLHVAIWPGSAHNTRDITRFMALESRSFIISASTVNRADSINPDMPHAQLLQSQCEPLITDGGSCIAAPDGTWLLEPVLDKTGVFTADLDLDFVLRERQNFDPVGHYSRPDVLKLSVNRRRQQLVDFQE